MAYHGKQNKFFAKKVTINGVRFDSIAEARQYAIHQLLEQSGEIRNLKRQIRYDFEINGIHIGHYKSDIEYDSLDGKHHVVDVKSPRTRKNPDYVLKKKLMLALHGITIEEIVT